MIELLIFLPLVLFICWVIARNRQEDKFINYLLTEFEKNELDDDTRRISVPLSMTSFHASKNPFDYYFAKFIVYKYA